MKKALIYLLSAVSLVTMVGCGNNTKYSDNKKAKQSEEMVSSEMKDEMKDEKQVGLEEKNVDVTLDDAIAAYQKKYPEATIHKIKLKKAKGEYVYEIKGYEGDQLHEVFINANNKEIIAAEKNESDIEKDKTPNPLVLDGIIKPVDAIKNGFETVKDESIILGWSLENEGNKILYKLHLKNKTTGAKSEIILDAKTGKTE